jgi:cytochrome c-type biogenesis protein CcmH
MKFLLAFLLFINPALAVLPDERLADPALESRARVISKELRCMICQNQSIDDSDATLAKDLRLLVRERLQAGDTNDAILSYVQQRYGDIVLLKPPFNAATIGLWAGPFVILLIAGVMLLRRRGEYEEEGEDA